jgi:hypothetical protein
MISSCWVILRSSIYPTSTWRTTCLISSLRDRREANHQAGPLLDSAFDHISQPLLGRVASDALGASRIGDSGFASLTSVSAQSVLVRAESIERVRQLLWDDMRLVVEPGGATALAALLQGAYVPAAGEQVAVVVCGANADLADLTRLTAGVRPR